MDTLRIILLVLAIVLIIATIISYLSFRKLKNKKVSKSDIDKARITFTVLTIFGVILSILAIIFNVVLKDDAATTITLDINPSIEIKLNKEERIIKVNALNEDAKKIVDDSLKDKVFEDALNMIADKLIENDFARPNDELSVIVYSEGEMKSHDVGEKINGALNSKEIRTNLIVVDNVTKEDIEFAKKNSIGVGKAAYINSITKENSNISADDLIDKPVNEINETKVTGKYCEKGYSLEGDFCFKEIGREPAISGMVCPSNYYLKDGKCYEETGIIEIDEYECREGQTLVGNKCTFVEHIEANANFKCEKGDLIKRGEARYRKYRDSGNPEEYACEDKSEAVAPKLRCLYNSGHIMINGKCYNGPAPLINGGCPGNDVVRNGWCYSLDNEDQWQCPDGNIYEKSKGTYTDLCPDTFKYTKATGSYSCPEGYTLNKNTCERTREEDAMKKRTCPTGYTRTNDERCINTKNTKNLVDGYYCEKQETKLFDTTCVIYDIVEAKHN